MSCDKDNYSGMADSSYWKNRRTIRSFTDEEVDGQLIFDLIDKACKAPTTGGMQLYSVVITSEMPLLEKLRECHFNQPAAKNAKLIMTVVADFNRFDKWCTQREAKPGFDNFESFVAAFLDATIFSQQLTTLMELSGLGVCWLGTATYTASRIGELLHLPRLTVPVASLAVGWPADDGVEAERLPAGAVIHEETYDDYTPERIDEIFAEKEVLAVNKKFVEDNEIAAHSHLQLHMY